MSEWPRFPLAELVQDGQISYGVVQPGNDTGGGVPIVRVKDVRHGIVDTSSPIRVHKEIAAKHSRTTLTGGELLLSLVGTVGESAVAPKSLAGWNVARAIAVIRPTKVSSRWLQLCFESAPIRAEILGVLNTTVQSTLNLADLKRLRIPAPPSEIRSGIEEVVGALDDKIAANTKLAATAGELAGLIFDQATINLDMRPMSDVLSPVLGGTPQRSRSEFWDGNQLWASAKDITGAEFGVITDTDEKITHIAISGTKAKPLPKGSVILTARGTVGTVARLAMPSSFNQSCYGFVPGVIPPGILYFAVMRASQRAKEIAHGSVFDTITMKTFDHLPFPRFDDATLSSLENRIGPLLDTVAASVVENANLARTRDALLPQLMSGNLRVKDPETVLEKAGV